MEILCVPPSVRTAELVQTDLRTGHSTSTNAIASNFELFHTFIFFILCQNLNFLLLLLRCSFYVSKC